MDYLSSCDSIIIGTKTNKLSGKTSLQYFTSVTHKDKVKAEFENRLEAESELNINPVKNEPPPKQPNEMTRDS
jgi:hypothetical protein